MSRVLRRVLVYVLGFALVLFGLLGLVLPLHPGLLFIALGLAVIAMEARWARRLYARLGKRIAEADVDSERLERWQARLERWLPQAPDDGPAEDQPVDEEGACDDGSR